ncbi:MAG: XRE family transcriptional regulator [Ruminococcaceae bacterium]|nr:XRE family transcriptional regulator [Oscillospiraceae bacterium]
MRKRQLTSLGLEIKMELFSAGQTQEWLIEQVKKKTGMYVDSSNLYKLMTGQSNSKKLKNAICDILQIQV